MKPVLLYDGDCGFCSRIVSIVLRHEKQNSLSFAALKSPVASVLLRDQPQLQQTDSVMWVELDDNQVPQKILLRSAAALRLCAYLGSWWNLLRIGWLIPKPWRDKLYDVIARNRHRLLRNASCTLPPTADRQRFLETSEDLVSQRAR